MDTDKMAERIINLTLEILFRLTGEDYTVVTKTSSERCQDPVSEGWRRTLSPIMEPPPHPLIHEEINREKILELTNKMIELLTGEVPIRCQDVTVYFSMEEWEYLEGHKDQYKDVMMEDHWPLTSPVKEERRTPERCPSPLLPQDGSEEHHNVPQDDQLLNNIKAAETDVRGDEQSIEDISTDNRPDNCTRSSEEHLISSDLKADDHAFTQDTYEEPADIQDVPSALHNKDPSSNIFHWVLSFDLSKSVDHKKAHTGKKPYSCSECGKCFKDTSNLVIHQRKHMGLKPYLCSECGKCFNQKSGLVIHQRIHTGEKPFPCSECGKRFKDRSHLVVHHRIHTGVKPFPCPECEKRFVTKSNLVDHQKSHTRAKSLSCTECGERFTQKLRLVAHQKTHTGEKPYSCSECGQCFKQNSDLVEHQRIHTGEKPYSCLECGKCFPQKSGLVDHEKTHGGEAKIILNM